MEESMESELTVIFLVKVVAEKIVPGISVT